jgi:hypothetical protein
MIEKNAFLSILAIVTGVLILFLFSPDKAYPSLYSVSDSETDIQTGKLLNEAFVESLQPVQMKSPARAFIYSAVVPGTGELYSKSNRGFLFMAAEIAFWTAYAVIHGQAEDNKDDYVTFVDEHIVFEDDSPVNSTDTWTLEDYEHATQADNWHYVYTESNGKPLDRVGKFYWADLPADMIDQPGGIPLSESQSQFRAEAFEKRVSTNDKFKQSKMFIGLVVLNHIVSAIDARIAATTYNNKIPTSTSQISFHPTLSPSGHAGVYLTFRKSF